MSLLPKLGRQLFRAFSIASFTLIAVAPSVTQQRRPVSSPVDIFVFEGGGGFAAPAGGTSNQIDWGYNLLGGFGIKESRYTATIAEFQYDHASLARSYLNQQVEPDGHRTIRSLTVNQKVNLSGGPTHAYLIGGGGWYHQTTTFTEPSNQVSCDPFGVCFPVGDLIIGQFSTDQVGANVGGGFEHRFTPYSNAKLFVEARYTYLDTPAHATQVVPVTIGVRF